MFRLTDDQYSRIAQSFTDELRQRAVREFSPRLKIAPVAAERQVLQAFARAEAYHLSEPDQIWQFIEYDVTIMAGFDEHPAYAAVRDELAAPDMSADLRLFYAAQEIRHIMKQGATP